MSIAKPNIRVADSPAARVDHWRLAVDAHGRGQLDAAEAHCRAMLLRDGADPDALGLLGVIDMARANFERAAAWLERAAAVQPPQAVDLSNLGAAYRSLGLLDRALETFHRAIAIDADYAGAHYNLGLALEAAGRLAESAESLRQSLNLEETAEGWHALGRVLSAEGHLVASLDAFRHALDMQPQFAAAEYNLGNALARLDRHAESLAAYDRALALLPQHRTPAAILARIRNNKGDALKSLGRHDDALAEFRAAAALAPDLAEAHNNLGTMLEWQQDWPAAEAAYRRAIRCDRRFHRAHTNLGNLHLERGRLADSLECYNESLRLRDDQNECRFNRALLYLRQADFARGWPEYECRFDAQVARRAFSQPRWDGSPLAGRSLLVFGEQGLGDEIMFASCLPDLFGQEGSVVVECDQRLWGLFARSFGWAQIVVRPVGESTTADLQIPAGSLPALFRNDRADFRNRGGYLRADSARRAGWRKKLDADEQCLLVGCSWKGGAEPHIQRKRSTVPGDWRPLLELPGARFVDLQYGDHAEDRDAFDALGGSIVRPAIDLRNDVDELAALIAACDLVISVDNSTVHLAGALGVPTWTLLPFSADWRWLDGTRESLWYPSVRLFRQPVPGDWSAVFRQAAGELDRWLHGARR